MTRPIWLYRPCSNLKKQHRIISQLLYKLSGYLAENGNLHLAKSYLKKALTINFALHTEMFLDFPGLQSKRWILNLIEKFQD